MLTAIIQCAGWYYRSWLVYVFFFLFSSSFSLSFFLQCFVYTMLVYIHSHLGFVCAGFNVCVRALAFMSHSFCWALSCLRSSWARKMPTRKYILFYFWLIIFSCATERIHIQENANDKMLPSMSCSVSCASPTSFAIVKCTRCSALGTYIFCVWYRFVGELKRVKKTGEKRPLFSLLPQKKN